jgi:hypothetical protein
MSAPECSWVLVVICALEFTRVVTRERVADGNRLHNSAFRYGDIADDAR